MQEYAARPIQTPDRIPNIIFCPVVADLRLLITGLEHVHINLAVLVVSAVPDTFNEGALDFILQCHGGIIRIVIVIPSIITRIVVGLLS